MTPISRIKRSRDAWKVKAVTRAESLRERRKQINKERSGRKSAEAELKRLKVQRPEPPLF